MTIVIPLEKSKAATAGETMRENVQEMKDTVTNLAQERRAHPETPGAESRGRTSGTLTIGILLIVVGLILLLVVAGPFNTFWWFRLSLPLITIIIGVVIIFVARRRV